MLRIKTVDDIAKLVCQSRKKQGLTQTQLAAVSGVGVRFIVDLEKGKQTCQIGKVLRILVMLGIQLNARE